MGNKESAAALAGKPPRSVAQTQGGMNAGIQTQKDAIAVLEKKIDLLNVKADEERKKAKQFMALSQKSDKVGNTAKAKRHLKRSKVYQQQAAKFEGMRNNLEGIQDNLESAAMSVKTAQAMQAGASTMKQQKTALDTDKIADLVDDLEETQADLAEASDALSRPIGEDPGLEMELDDDMNELLREVNEEEAEPVAKTKTKKPAPRVPDLPEAPTSKVEVGLDEDEDSAELNALMAELNS